MLEDADKRSFELLARVLVGAVVANAVLREEYGKALEHGWETRTGASVQQLTDAIVKRLLPGDA